MAMKRSSNVPAEAMNHVNNCAIVASAAATGLPYVQVLAEFSKSGIYNGRKGTTVIGQERWLRENGYWLRRTYFIGTLARAVRELPRDRVYLIFTQGHCQALVRGEHVNTSARARCRVHFVWEVVRQERPVNAVVELLFTLPRLGINAKSMAQHLQLEERQVRAQIDRARRAGWEIVNEDGNFRLVLD